MSILHDIHRLGQSIWYDFISRDFIASGQMQELVETGIRGMTSNPTIFEQAIAKGNDYDEQIKTLDVSGASLDDIATALFVTDIQNACDVIRPVYDESDGVDGYISLEVSPTLAHETDATIKEAQRLWAAVDRPNLMIKIPATPEGIPAVQSCISQGINVNITLIFSLEQYQGVCEAYLAGLEARSLQGEALNRIHSVASVFVSRIDAMIDSQLQALGTPEALALQGKAGVANTKMVYQAFQQVFSGERWESLASQGANLQRPLWASTSTKNPDYPDLLYINTVIGPHTINTVPPATLEAIIDHGTAALTVEDGVKEAKESLEKIEQVGIVLPDVMSRLLQEGVQKFAQSFHSLFEKLEAKREHLRSIDVGS